MGTSIQQTHGNHQIVLGTGDGSWQVLILAIVTVKQHQLLLAMRTSLSADWRLRGRLGPALGLNNDPQTERTSTLGAAFGLGLERTLGPGAIRLDASAFALGDATGRLGISISYDFRVDRSR